MHFDFPSLGDSLKKPSANRSLCAKAVMKALIVLIVFISLCGDSIAKSETASPEGAGAKKLNGLLVDPARVPESLEYYRRLIKFCADWNLNVLIFRLADDQGSAIRFEKHPELLTHKNAFTPQELRELALYAQSLGIELIPEIESFGHTRYITGVPQYEHLSDREATKKDFTGLIPVHPQTLELIADLYREVASIFPSKYLHGGCDEVNWGGAELSKNALKTKSKTQIWAEYVNSLNKIARSQNKELIIWGDHVLREDPKILPLMSKDIIIIDWNYEENDPAKIEITARQALANGLRVIGGPALGWCRWGPRPGTGQLQNINAYADAYRQIDDPRSLGVIVTNWLPSRYVQNSIWDEFAYAAVAINEGSARAQNIAFKRFVEKHYGAQWNEAWSDIFRTYYDIVPNRKSCSPKWMGPPIRTPWRSEADLAAVLQSGPINSPPFERLDQQLALRESSVTRNQDDFRAFRLSVKYFEHLFWRSTAIVLAAQKKSNKAAMVSLINEIAERDRKLFSALNADWDRGRPVDSPMKTEEIFDYEPEDQIVMRAGEAAKFSSQLAADPDRFIKLLNSPK